MVTICREHPEINWAHEMWEYHWEYCELRESAVWQTTSSVSRAPIWMTNHPPSLL